MFKEVSLNHDERSARFLLRQEDIFVSSEHNAFTELGSLLFGLFVIHKSVLGKLDSDNSISDERKTVIRQETEQRYRGIEELWGRKIPRDDEASEYLSKQVILIVNQHMDLLSHV